MRHEAIEMVYAHIPQGQKSYCIDSPLRFSDLPLALLIIIYVWH